MEPITLIALGAAVAFIAWQKKKKDTKPRIYEVHYEDLQTAPQKVNLRAGDAVEVVLPGLREQWRLEVAGGGGLVLDAMLDIGVLAERGVVTYSLVAQKQPKPWSGQAEFFNVGVPAGTIEINYVV